MALARTWEIFDYPCGQRLKPLMETQTDRPRRSGKLAISDEVADKLKKIRAAIIDRKLKHQIAIRLTSWQTAKAG